MGIDDGKVHRLETIPKEEPQSATPASCGDDVQRDMSKVAMIVSLLAVLLLVVFFFGMNRNIAGLTDEVKSFGVLREEVVDLDQRMVKMQDELPSRMKRMLAYDVVNEMAMKAFYLADTLENQELRAKMSEVLTGLKEIRDDLEK